MPLKISKKFQGQSPGNPLDFSGPGYPFPIRSFDNNFSEEHWNVLNACARKVAKRFGNRVEVGDLIREGWLGYARHHKSLKSCHGFVYKAMYRWAKGWLSRTLPSTDDKTETLDANHCVPVCLPKTCENAEMNHELSRRINRLSERDRMIVKLYLLSGNMRQVGEATGLSRERVRQILRKVTR